MDALVRSRPSYSCPSTGVYGCAMSGEQGPCSCGNMETTTTMGPSHLWEGGVEERVGVLPKESARVPAPPGSRHGEEGGTGLALPKERPYWRGAERLGVPARLVTGSRVDPAVPVKGDPVQECLGACNVPCQHHTHTHTVQSILQDLQKCGLET